MIKKQVLVQLQENFEALVNRHRESVWSEEQIEKCLEESATLANYRQGFKDGCEEFIKLMDHFNEQIKEV
jgi:hypothetical protein